MILYLDTSALVKRYVSEPGSVQVAQMISTATVVGTSILSRVEVAAALAKAVRMNALTRSAAVAALQAFHGEWPHFVRVQATELTVSRADTLAWELGLRGYDAMHLASALVWQDGMDERIVFATFDRRLWQAAAAQGLISFPTDLPGLLTSWQ